MSIKILQVDNLGDEFELDSNAEIVSLKVKAPLIKEPDGTLTVSGSGDSGNSGSGVNLEDLTGKVEALYGNINLKVRGVIYKLDKVARVEGTNWLLLSSSAFPENVFS